MALKFYVPEKKENKTSSTSTGKLRFYVKGKKAEPQPPLRQLAEQSVLETMPKIGLNLIQPKETDSTLGKVGKGIVNYGVGSALRTLDAPFQLIKQGAYNLRRAATGQKADFSKNLTALNVLLKPEEEAAFKQKTPKLYNLANLASETILDPTTYVAGGIIDDLAKAGATKLGAFGKYGTTGTTENVEALGRMGQKILGGQAAKPAAKTTAKVADNIKFSSDKIPSGQRIKDTWSTVYQEMVDKNNAIKDISQKAYVKATNNFNIGGTVDTIYTGNLVDRMGRPVGESLQSLVQKIDNPEDFWKYALHKHNISRAAQKKSVWKGMDAATSAKKVAQYEAKFPQFAKTQKDIVNWLDKFNETWALNDLVDKSLWDKLKSMYPDYIPVREADSAAGRSIGKGIAGKHTVIKAAKTVEDAVQNPVATIMEYVNKVVKTVSNNEVGKTIYSVAKTDPERFKGIMEVVKAPTGFKNVTDPDKIIETLSKELSGASKGSTITIMINGKPKGLKIYNKPLLDALTGVMKTDLPLEKQAKAATNLFKQLITQKNPIFSIKNVFRDLPTAYVFGHEHNPVRFFNNYINAYKELITDTDLAKQYKALGGSRSSIFSAGDSLKSAEQLAGGLTKEKGVIKNLLDKIEYINNLTEMAPRFAEFKLTKGTGESYAKLMEAFYNASDLTVNFARGGRTAKVIDAYVPYFNAAMQGLDKLGRHMTKSPKEFILGGVIGITLPSAALFLINKDNPAYQALDNRTKDANFLIPVSEDKFIRIPKSRELGFLFGSLFERLGRVAMGEPGASAFKGFTTTTATQILPTNPVENNLISPLINLGKNKDFAGRTIVPASMEYLSPKYQYDEKTTEIAKAIGQKTNLSPKQIDYLIRSYTGIIGQVIQPATTKGQGVLSTLSRQFTADALYNNQTIVDFYDNYDKLKTMAADKNMEGNIPGKVVTGEESIRNKLSNISSSISEKQKFINKLTVGDDPDRDEKIRTIRRQIIDLAAAGNLLTSNFLKGRE